MALISYVAGGNSVCRVLGREVEGSLVCRKDGVKTPSEHCLGTLEQGTEPPNAHIGPLMSELLIKGHLAFAHMQLG